MCVRFHTGTVKLYNVHLSACQNRVSFRLKSRRLCWCVFIGYGAGEWEWVTEPHTLVPCTCTDPVTVATISPDFQPARVDWFSHIQAAFIWIIYWTVTHFCRSSNCFFEGRFVITLYFSLQLYFHKQYAVGLQPSPRLHRRTRDSNALYISKTLKQPGLMGLLYIT